MNGGNPSLQVPGTAPADVQNLPPCSDPALMVPAPTRPEPVSGTPGAGLPSAGGQLLQPAATGETAGAITLFTIGFARKSARDFFESLRKAGVRKVVDIRLNNVSQLAGFTKKHDLAYFLEAIAQIRYEHRPELAPTKEILDGYKKKRMTWPQYEELFNRLIAQRQIESLVRPEQLQGACLLCSEPTPEKCHRRLVAEYLRAKWGDTVRILHL